MAFDRLQKEVWATDVEVSLLLSLSFQSVLMLLQVVLQRERERENMRDWDACVIVILIIQTNIEKRGRKSIPSLSASCRENKRRRKDRKDWINRESCMGSGWKKWVSQRRETARERETLIDISDNERDTDNTSTQQMDDIEQRDIETLRLLASWIVSDWLWHHEEVSHHETRTVLW